MHRFWDTIVGPALEAVEPKVIVEIGSDRGLNTRNLLSFCAERGGRLHVIDPMPRYDTSEWRERYGALVTFHRDLSLNALPGIEGAEVVLIDGDHNWYTVFNELGLIGRNSEEQGRPFPLVMLHDVGWPYGRRDLYYDPETIPAEHRKPCRKGGMFPDSMELLEEGGLNQHLCNAAYEGGPRNGVLTAVEDFLEETERALEFLRVPGLHGLGLLYPPQLKDQNTRLASFIGTLDAGVDSSVTARWTGRVERARLEAEILREEQATAHEGLEDCHRELEARYADLETQHAKLESSQGRQAGEVERLRGEIGRLEEALRTQEARLRTAEKRISDKDRRLATLRREKQQETRNVRQLMRWMEDLDRDVSALLGSRQWQAGHALGALYRRVRLGPRGPAVPDELRSTLGKYRRWRLGSEEHRDAPLGDRPSGRPEPGPNTRQPAEPSMSRGELAREIRRRMGPVPELEGWPSVSIVVPNRNDSFRVRRLFSGLRDRTEYPGDVEVVLVDDGSTDGPAELARAFGGGFQLKVVENNGASFPAANNRGAGEATGELLLFLDAEVEPFEPGWLGEMVGCLRASGTGSVGACLLYPNDAGHGTASGYAVRHRGMKFRDVRGDVRHYNLGNGEDALGGHLGADVSCPAVSAACLLMERETFRAVGGFTAGYRCGGEGLDLGLKVLALGRENVCCGRAVLLHEESVPRDAEDETLRRIGRINDRWLFRERWGPPLHRGIRLDRLENEGYWTEGGPHVAITVTSKDQEDGHGDWYVAHELGDALEERGWRVTYVQRKNEEWYSPLDDTDYLLVLTDRYDVSRVPGVESVAWVRDRAERWAGRPWFEHFDVVLAASRDAAEVVGRATGKAAALFPAATDPGRFARTPPNPAYEADYVFAGNPRGEDKAGQRLVGSLDVLPGERVMIFGKGWEDVPRAARYARGHLPYDRLPQAYSSAKLVLDDAEEQTSGSVNPRVFDALAAGTLVVTNGAAGVRELFDEDFPTYGDRRELRAALDRLLKDDARREELAGRYREVVLREHTYGRRAEQFVDLLRARAEALSFCIKIGPSNWEKAPLWGDLHFARAMRRQLERRGHPCLIQILEEWDDFEGLRYDVAIHLKGRLPYAPKPGQFNVLWNISHPDELTARECDKYDLVFVASGRFAEQLRRETETPVLVLQQATDPEVFFPDPDPAHGRDLVFVGNTRNVERTILRDLLPTEHDLAVWGLKWKGLIDPKYLAGDHLPNDEVRRAYSSAAIVLNDHWDDMREHGFVSNRIYDALACGALVLSDHVPEIEELFGDAVVTYETPEDLHRLVDHYLAAPEERREKGRRGRELVLGHHTFEHRMEVLLREVERRAAEVSSRTRIALPAGDARRAQPDAP